MLQAVTAIATNMLAVAGALYLSNLAYTFMSRVYSLYGPSPISISKYTADNAWAIVTGASDGIGKEFALALAKRGFNILIMARTQSKLDAVAKEAKEKANKKIECKVIAFDFMNASDAEYASLQKTLDSLNVTVLVNNVGVNHDIPTPFVDETAATIDGIVQVNVKATMKITRIVLPAMIAKHKGIILNLGSFAGQVPTGYLSVYSASKAWLKSWSLALDQEVKSKGVIVQHLNTYFVTTGMSKIRKASMTTPTAKDYVRAAIASIGKGPNVTPFWSHSWAEWAMTTFVPEAYLVGYSASLNAGIRKRALAKRERESKRDN
ncbi:hypothetical protein SmJEL517_g04352 [Synchytrium microbalum]|uniref:Very-long-chain 3-oxoacyl-CoA reductase n=1 Tax=Synchytrium microbalum TaxID=1806994 RepID=A0A507C390_9FUNG|nr:uncharacterized protein SmJEL517_g04352 [Synchytrium microbalum]TPX32554.1 hypothetical protein SmJEL517_g04352 [Synchytrium microbalum]